MHNLRSLKAPFDSAPSPAEHDHFALQSTVISLLDAISIVGNEIIVATDGLHLSNASNANRLAGVIPNLACLAQMLINSNSAEELIHATLRPETISASFRFNPTKATTIGERIRELRKMHNLTLKDIAEATGVTQQAVHLWESKGAIPSCDKLIPLANALECDPLWLIGK